jgi:hypothetical protein
VSGRPIAALLIVALGAAPAAALGSSGKGTSGAAFLTLTPGAREAAMGGALGGAADGAMSAHYNPAGLGFVESVEAAAGREARFAGLDYDYAALAVPVLAWTRSPRPVGDLGATAAAVYSLTAAGLERRGLTETDAPTGSFGASDRAFALSYGRKVGEGLAVGGTLKWVDAQLDATHGSAATGDAGVLFRRETWSAGAGVRNAFGSLALGSVSDPLPASAFAGASWRPREGWLLAVEAVQPRADASSLAFGVERRKPVTKELTAAMRGGWRTDRMDGGFWGGLSQGFGVEWKGLAADLGWSPGGVLGDLFQYSVRARF